MTEPSTHQLERFIRENAVESFNVAFTDHARKRMRQRRVTAPMVMETLRLGCIRQVPEPDMRFSGKKCRMERLVSGVVVGVVVYVDYPEPGMVVVTVIDLGE